MSASTPGPMPSVSVSPVSAWRTTATFSGTAARIRRTSPADVGSTSTWIPWSEISVMSGETERTGNNRHMDFYTDAETSDFCVNLSVTMEAD